MYVYRKKGVRDDVKRINREEANEKVDKIALSEEYRKREVQDESFRRQQEADFIKSLTTYHVNLTEKFLNSSDGVDEIEEVKVAISKLDDAASSATEIKEDIRDIFSLVDKDMSGFIDIEELRSLLSIMGINPSQKTMNKVIATMTGGNEKLTYNSVKVSFDCFYKWYAESRNIRQEGADTNAKKLNIFQRAAHSLFSMSKGALTSMVPGRLRGIVMQTRARKYIRKAVEFQASELARTEYRKARPPKYYCPNCNATFLTNDELILHSKEAAGLHETFHKNRESVIQKIRPIWDVLQGENGHRLHAKRILFDIHMVPSLFRSAVCIQQPIRPFIEDKNETRSNQLKTGMTVEGYDPSTGKRPGYQSTGFKSMHIRQSQHFSAQALANNEGFADILLRLQTEWIYQAMQLTVSDVSTKPAYSWITIVDQPSQCCDITIWWSGRVMKSAFLCGSFTGWEKRYMIACPMTGKYNLTVSVSPAIHYYCFEIDGVESIELNQPVAIVHEMKANSESTISFADRNVLVVSNGSSHNSTDYLRSLKLNERDLNDDGIWALSQPLARHQSINYIDFCTNNISDRGAESISSVIRSTNSLVTLKLSNNKIGYDGCRSIAEALMHNSTLQFLDLRQNPLGDDGIEAISMGLTCHKFMRVVCFDRCRISDDGAKVLAKAIMQQKSIITLSLRFNDIREVGAKYLADALERNAALRNLYLSHNPLLPNGCEHIFASLSKNDTILRLDMSFTDMGDMSSMNAVYAFSTSIKLHKSLLWVDISGNKLGNTAALTMADNIRYNKSILQVDMEFNDFDDCWKRSMHYIATHLCPRMPSIQTTCDINKLRNIGKTFKFLEFHHNISWIRGEGSKLLLKPSDMGLGLCIDDICSANESLGLLTDGYAECDRNVPDCSWNELKELGNIETRRKAGMKPWEFMESDFDTTLRQSFNDSPSSSQSVLLRREFQRRSGFHLSYTLVDLMWPISQQSFLARPEMDISLLPLVACEFSYGDVDVHSIPEEIKQWLQKFLPLLSELVCESKENGSTLSKGQWSQGRRWNSRSKKDALDQAGSTRLTAQKATNLASILHTDIPKGSILQPPSGSSVNECRKMHVECEKRKGSINDDEFCREEEDFIHQQVQTRIMAMMEFFRTAEGISDVSVISRLVSSTLATRSSLTVDRMSGYYTTVKSDFQASFVEYQSLQNELLQQFPEIKQLGIVFAACLLATDLGKAMDVDDKLNMNLNCWAMDLKNSGNRFSNDDDEGSGCLSLTCVDSRWDKEIFEEQKRMEREAVKAERGEIAEGKYGNFNSMECHAMLREKETVSNEVVNLTSRLLHVISSIRGVLIRDNAEDFDLMLSAISSCGYQLPKLSHSDRSLVADKIICDPGMEHINVILADSEAAEHAAWLAKFGCISLEEEQARYVRGNRDSKLADGISQTPQPKAKLLSRRSSAKEKNRESDSSYVRHSVSAWMLCESACCGFLSSKRPVSSAVKGSAPSNLFCNLDVESISRSLLLIYAILDCVDGAISLFRIEHPPRFICPLCAKRFSKAQQLQDHFIAQRNQFDNISADSWNRGRPDESILLALHRRLYSDVINRCWARGTLPISDCDGSCQFHALELLKMSVRSVVGSSLAAKLTSILKPEPCLPCYFVTSPTAEIRVYDAFDDFKRPLGILARNSVVKIVTIYGTWARINIENGRCMGYVHITYPSLDSTLVPLSHEAKNQTSSKNHDPIYSVNPSIERGSYDPRYNPEFKVRRGPKRSRRTRQILVDACILQMSLFNLDPFNCIHDESAVHDVALSDSSSWYYRVRSVFPTSFRVKIRQKPSFDAAVLGTLVPGEIFKATGHVNGIWFQIEHPALSLANNYIISSFWVASCIDDTNLFQTMLGSHVHRIRCSARSCPFLGTSESMLFNEISDSGHTTTIGGLIISDFEAQSICQTDRAPSIEKDIAQEISRVRISSKFCIDFSNELESVKDY